MDVDLASSRPGGEQPPQLFRPRRLVHNGHLQTLLTRILPQGAGLVAAHEQPVLFDAGEDRTGYDPGRAVRLLGYFTARRSSGPRRGLVLQLHGWEGCSHSAYNLILGSHLVAEGYDVLRLDLRDHGPTHHLNRGFFHASLLDEVLTVARQVAVWAGPAPFFILGASLGGNFALRLALRHGEEPFHNLARVVAINPVINPVRTSALLERQPSYHHYFRRRWLASLRKKQTHFPETFDFGGIEAFPTIRGMTNWLLERYGPFDSVDAYLRSYQVEGAALESLSVPTTIITAANDPVIHPEDFAALPAHPLLDVRINPSGGHVGYVDLFPFGHHLPRMVLPLLVETP